MNNFTIKAQEAIQTAHNIAIENNQQQVDVSHLMLALLSQEDGVILAVLKKMRINIDKLKTKANILIKSTPESKNKQNANLAEMFISPLLQKTIFLASREAKKTKDEYVSTEHFFLSILSIPSTLKDALNKEFKIDYNKTLKILADVRGSERITEPDAENKYQVLEKYTINLTKMARNEEIDPIIGRDNEIRRIIQVLSRRTKNNPVLVGEAGVGKTAIAEGLAQRIVAKDVPESLKNRELISLDLGSLVAGTKFRGEFENRLKAVLKKIKKSANYILFIDEMHTLVGAGGAEGAIDASNMLKPALARGELHCIGATTLKEYQKHIEKDAALERRFQQVYVKEPTIEDAIAILRGIKEKYEIHHGVRITDKAIISAVNLSKRYISDRFLPDKAIDLMDEACSGLRMEIESQPEELDKLQRKYRQIELEIAVLKKDKKAKQQKINLKKELANLKEEIKAIKIRWRIEKDIITEIHKTKENIDKLKQESEIAERETKLQKVAEIKYGLIPELTKKIKTYQKRLKKIQKNERILKEEIGEEEVAKIVSRWTGIPVTKMMEEESEKLSKMEQEIHKRLIGQSEAVIAVSNAIRRSMAGISEENKPIGSFIFLGPTGVGKSELAKSLAEFLFNTQEALIQVDMSEYMESHAVSKIIGSPPGYVGYEEGGQLTEIIRKKPYSVILFDEIEKAHPKIFNILLQILDEGKLTDAKGRTVNFKNTVIIMTSNIGTDLIKEYSEKSNIGFESETKKQTQGEIIEEKIYNSLRKTFKPEFLNRIDEIIIFHSLNKKDIKKIVDLQLKKVAQRLKQKKLKLVVTDKAKNLLTELGFDIVYGARPLKRVIQKEILDKLALIMISGKADKKRVFRVDVKNKKIFIK